ncbi:MAG TPA: XRE family transcriptional regulator [Candidatus Methylomirabilis sp.]|nr:XRE family transcriptional regulator [Candidatus Methylomirabilis sp.]HSB79036.1 XRE family transcriptional regulator [Candidatus Methylomirabilis sp.]
MRARIPGPAPQIQKAIEAPGLKQAQSAKLLGVTWPRVSDLVRGRPDLFA